MKALEQHYISKIEGHGYLKIDLRQNKAELIVDEGERYFEKLVIGRRFQDAHYITSRICGVCPVAHQMAAIKAVEDAFKIKVNETIISFRKILLSAQIIQSHTLHLYFLALPDYLGLDSTLSLADKDPKKLKAALNLKHFADEVNTHIFSSGYTIAINPITEEKEFWKIVEENENKIEKLTFSFNSPNLFGIKNSLNEDLKDLQKEYSSTKVSLELENPDGKLNIPKNDLTKQSVEYVTKGGGQYSLKIKGKYKKVISSKDNIKTKTFDDLDIHINGSNQETLFSILDTIFK